MNKMNIIATISSEEFQAWRKEIDTLLRKAKVRPGYELELMRGVNDFEGFAVRIDCQTADGHYIFIVGRSTSSLPAAFKNLCSRISSL